MAPIFNFPLPSFRSYSSNQSTPGSQSSPNSTPGVPFPSPLNQNLSKAEKVLVGPSVYELPERAKKQGRKEKRLLRKPSFISVTLTDSQDHHASDGEPELDLGPSRPDLKRLGSSPLLGKQATPSFEGQDYFSSANKPASQPLALGSYEYYHNESRNPRLVSQERLTPTSQDPSIRKGPPQLASSAGNTLDEIVSPGRSQLDYDRQHSEADLLRRTTHSRIRRRPSITDPPTLYPDTPRQFQAVSPPPALINSTLPKPMHFGDTASKPLGRPRWWQRTRTEPPSALQSSLIEPTVFQDNSRASALPTKVHTRKPTPGARNWFDELDEDDMQLGQNSADADLQGGPQSEHAAPSPPKSQSTIAPLHRNLDGKQKTSRKSSFSSKSGRSDRKLSFNLEPVQLGPPNFFASAPSTWTSTRLASPEGRSLQSTRSSKSLGPGINLQIHSVLNLSSSDDEDDSNIFFPQASSHRRQEIRTSVDRADRGDDILLGHAQQVLPARPRPVVSQNARHRSPRRSKTPERVPPVPQLPTHPPVEQRQSSLRWRQMMDDKGSTTTEGGRDSTAESGSNGETPLTTPISSRASSSAHKKKGSIRASKLMKVTTEEEKLLEAMRAKRASIRANNFQEGFNKAIALQNDPKKADMIRPTTAGAVDGGRDPFRRSLSLCDPQRSTTNSNRSSKKSSRDSISPLPLLSSARYTSHTPKSSFGFPGNQKSSSTDNLLLDDEVIGMDLNQSVFPFPPMAPPPRTQLPKPPVELRIQPQVEPAPSKLSPSLSPGASDGMAPSTPSTGNMPLTPPPMSIPMLPPDLVQGQGLGRTLSGSSRKTPGRAGHDRKRTVSSVVILDGCELAAQAADEEREIVGWAFNSY